MSRAARLLFYRITPSRQDPLVGVVWGGVLCENCIVDANAIKKATIIVLLFVFSFLWFCSWYFLLSVREKLCFLFFGRMVDAWVC